MELLEHGYKELLFPASASGEYAIEKHALHIWPRGRHMLMALPNLDGSFTGTIYLPNNGQESFTSLSSAAAVEAFFARYFTDTLALLPDLTSEFLANPVGVLGTVRAWPWSCDDRALLIGDASHAIVPFFGQGLNSGFEDCALLIERIDAGAQDRSDLFSSFASGRKPSADAIADMALENFVEMRDRVGDPAFLLRKRVEHRIETTFPERYRSRYAMVMYSFIPYRVALEVGLVQRRILDALCADISDADQADMEYALRLIDEHLAPVLEKHEVDLGF
jgi:kynurenine 3-monooxygenase